MTSTAFGPKKIARNIASGLFGQIGGLAIAFVTTPILVNGLGKSDYGLWSVATALGAWVGWINMVFSTSTIRFVGEALGRKNSALASEAAACLRRWSVVCGLIGMSVLAGLAPYLAHHVIEVDAFWRQMALKVLLMQAVFIYFQILTAVEYGIISAHQRLDVIQLIRTSSMALQSGGSALLVSMDFGLVHVAGWFAAIQALEWVAARLWVGRVQPAARARWQALKTWGGRLVRFGSPLVLGYAAAQLFLPSSRILLGSLRPVAEVSYLAVPLALALNVKALSTHIASAVLPAVSEKAGQSDVDGLRRLYLQGLRWSWLAVVPLAGLVIALGQSFIAAWISQEMGEAVGPVIPALVVGVNLYYLTSIPEVVAQGMGRPAPWAWMSLSAGALNCLAGWWLILHHGARGAAEALVIAGAVLMAGLSCWVGRFLKVTFTDYLRAFDWRILAVSAAVGFWLAQNAREHPLSLFSVMLLGLAGLFCFLLSSPWWLPADERRWLKRQWQAAGLPRQ